MLKRTSAPPLRHQRPSHSEDLLLQVRRGIPFVVLAVLGYLLLVPHVQIW